MKNIKTHASLVMGLLLVFVNFTSCKKETAAKEPTLISETIVPEPLEVKKEITFRQPVAFITGIDNKDESFYKNARDYFLNKNYEVIDYAFSMQEIMNWMNKNYDGNMFSEIHIVSKSNPWSGLAMETIVKGDRVTSESLTMAMANQKLPMLKNGISDKTKIIFHSNGLGENSQLLKTIKQAFMSDEVPTAISSPYYNIFGGEFSEHYLAKPYYGFYPTANSPGKVDLSKEFARKYPQEKEINWYDALNNEKERYIGEPYTIQFNIPVSWEFDYTDSDETIPSFRIEEEIMDWIDDDENLSKAMSKYNIPLEKFRWRSYKKGNKLIIKGKTTVLCVLKPLIKPYGDLQHVQPDLENIRLYIVE